jgi:hypothetical protein
MSSTAGSGSIPTTRAPGHRVLIAMAWEPVPQPTSTISSPSRGLQGVQQHRPPATLARHQGQDAVIEARVSSGRPRRAHNGLVRSCRVLHVVSMADPSADQVLDRTLAGPGSFPAMRRRGWSGRLWIGRDWWCFEGVSGDSRAHSHLCAQVVAGLDGPARVETEEESSRRPSWCDARRPPPASQFQGLRVIYPRPLGRLARRWNLNGWPERGGRARRVDAFADGPSPGRGARRRGHLGRGPADRSAAADRARRAGRRDSTCPLADAGRAVGRAVARPGPGRTGRAAGPLAAVAEAGNGDAAATGRRELGGGAAEAGFVDQPHLNRAMRRFFGVTPLTAAQAVGGVSTR